MNDQTKTIIVLFFSLIGFCTLSGCQPVSRIVFSEMHEEKDLIGDITKYNEKVAEMQLILTGLGYDSGGIDGVLGKKTREVIKAYQADHQIMVTGFIGRRTWGLLQEQKLQIKLSKITKPLTVREIQFALKKAGFDPGPIDGKSGWRTEEAVKKFQAAHGLVPDGIVGKKTTVKIREYI